MHVEAGGRKHMQILMGEAICGLLAGVSLFLMPSCKNWKSSQFCLKISQDLVRWSNPQSRLKLAGINPSRTYLIKFIPSFGFASILPKLPSSGAAWWLKTPLSTRGCCAQALPLTSICPVVICFWTTCPLMGGLFFVTEGGLCLRFEEEMGNIKDTESRSRERTFSACRQQRSKANLDRTTPNTRLSKTACF